jgi:rubredoxin
MSNSQRLAYIFLLFSLVLQAALSFSIPVRHVSVKSPVINKLVLSAKAKSDPVPNGYWEGEWICADCGYIYDKDIDGGGLYFEELKKGFICPQCSAPRRRYSKKVGDTWGITRDGGDFPIYATTFVGLALTTWFALVYVPSL